MSMKIWQKDSRVWVVHILSGQAEQIEAGGEAVNIVGIDDPDFAHEFGVDDGEIARTVLRSISYDKDIYTILLSHRPELLEVYAEAGAGLVFSGHATGDRSGFLLSEDSWRRIRDFFQSIQPEL